jgi:hypothetical protein
MELQFIETPIGGPALPLGTIALVDGVLVAEASVVWALESPVGFPDAIDPETEPVAWLKQAQITYSGSNMRAVLKGDADD